ncbi:phage tail protein [Streptomyces vinaceus]|uniref:phage tail protein n=1 Tax=Streptomyces vinaceus TaxID=1960 RepID=UPI00381153F5
MPMRHDSMLGMVMRFTVTVDGIDLGGWSSCRGLGVQFEHEELEVGANYEYNVLLPKRLKYSSITLQRAMNAEDSAKVAAWLRRVRDDWYSSDSGDGFPGSSATIVLLDARNDLSTPVYKWTLERVFPKSWKGPDLDAAGNGIAIESLELAHEGFL